MAWPLTRVFNGIAGDLWALFYKLQQHIHIREAALQNLLVKRLNTAVRSQISTALFIFFVYFFVRLNGLPSRLF